MSERNSSILVVEDNPLDFETTVRLLERAAPGAPVVRCESGDAALELLETFPPPPGLVVLDLNLPGTDGREVLATLRRDERWKTIPVVVLSTSTNPRDFGFCMKHGVGSYITKPATVEEFRTESRFVRVTAAGLKESHAHDVVITKEAPNYWVER